MARLTRRDFLAASAAAGADACGSESTGPAASPNILLVVPDQLRPDWTSLNPAISVRTPHLQALAARGVNFVNCYCASPLCAPSRACLAAGREYDRCGVPDNTRNYPLAQPTFYQALRGAGYRVAGVGKFDLHKEVGDPAGAWWELDGSRLLDEWGFTDGIDSEGKLDGSNSYRSAGAPRGQPYKTGAPAAARLFRGRGAADRPGRESPLRPGRAGRAGPGSRPWSCR